MTWQHEPLWKPEVKSGAPVNVGMKRICRNGIICNLQMKFMATNSKYDYKLSISVEMILDFDKSFTKTCPYRHI